jgi:Flp pilus assembly protein TadG
VTVEGRRARRGRGRLGGDDGNAIVEFVYLAVLLMVPLVYVLLTVFQVQRAAFAASSAAREAGRVFTTADDVGVGEKRARMAAGIVLRDSGLTLDADDLRITCSSSPCLEPGSRVVVVVSHRVTLPLLPKVFGDRGPASVTVSSQHLEVVDRYRAVRR